MEISLKGIERKNLKFFLVEHDKYHSNCEDSELTITTSHQDNGIGLATKVSCQCGFNMDITDYGAW